MLRAMLSLSKHKKTFSIKKVKSCFFFLCSKEEFELGAFDPTLTVAAQCLIFKDFGTPNLIVKN
ncbi:MAG: hypothetical protein A3B44_01795 [Candidatus Levybacteria bacterium RIFCSPLOWO2_01_FULL_38_21]|nr:MAG: hypothetical protein A3B44_01795 [Candidatus Levybacteria bacterium RIFCSPLOWO2_01_FULL_38_21]